MRFNSAIYIEILALAVLSFRFFPGGRILPGWRIFLLLAFSLVAYSIYSPSYLLLLILLSSGVFIAMLMEEGGIATGSLRTVRLIILSVLVLSPLLYYKYGRFILDILGEILAIIAGRDAGFLAVGMVVSSVPPGISFYTFQNLSYVRDVQTRRLRLLQGGARYLTYIVFFPQLVAGPIVRVSEFYPQILRVFRFEDVDGREAVFRILRGYLKKTVIADNLAIISDALLSGYEGADAVFTYLGVLSYAFRIYFDFSGYSDIAIGSAMLLGIRLPENFRYPYGAAGLSDFWGRWHITLSAWLRDHIYIPLGGSRHGFMRTILSLMITMSLGGLWHGAHRNYIVWGFFHGVLLVLERIVSRFFYHKNKPGIISRRIIQVYTFVMTTILWIPFMTGELHEKGYEAMWVIFRKMFDFENGLDLDRISAQHGIILVLSFLYVLTEGKLDSLWKKASGNDHNIFMGLTFAVVVVGIVIFAPNTSDFIYFIF